jgi:hypothetical protein
MFPRFRVFPRQPCWSTADLAKPHDADYRRLLLGPLGFHAQPSQHCLDPLSSKPQHPI